MGYSPELTIIWVKSRIEKEASIARTDKREKETIKIWNQHMLTIMSAENMVEILQTAANEYDEFGSRFVFSIDKEHKQRMESALINWMKTDKDMPFAGCKILKCGMSDNYYVICYTDEKDEFDYLKSPRSQVDEEKIRQYYNSVRLFTDNNGYASKPFLLPHALTLLMTFTLKQDTQTALEYIVNEFGQDKGFTKTAGIVQRAQKLCRDTTNTDLFDLETKYKGYI